MKNPLKISLRKASFSDIEFLWYLRNQPDVYKYSRVNRTVSWKEHINWILPIILGICNKELFIIQSSQTPAGQIRFDYRDSKEAEISISILKESRKKRIGTESFEKAVKLLKKTNKTKIVSAEIHKDNISSQRFFEKLNFKLKEREGDWLTYTLGL